MTAARTTTPIDARRVGFARGHARSHRRSAFTFVELIVSLTVTSILLMAIASAMLIAVQALPDPENPLTRAAEAARIVDQVAAELTYAITLERALENEIEFTVDRNGVVDTILYRWDSGGDRKLKRNYNGSEQDFDVVEDVEEFTLGYSVSQSAEQELASHPTAFDPEDFDVKSDNAIGQYFKPALPPDTVSWSVTRVRFRAMRIGSTQQDTLVQLRSADAENKPTSTVLEQVTMYESDLTLSYTWCDFSFSNVSGLDPADGLCLVLVSESGQSARVQFDDTGSGRVTTSDEGSNWNYDGDKSLVYYVYGTYTTTDFTGPGIHAVGITLNTTTDEATAARTTARLLNLPELKN